MTVAAIELEVSLHDGACGCQDTRTYDEFMRAVRSAHRFVWEWTRDRLPVDSGYSQRKHRIGGNPKATPNPDAVPLARQRTLTSPERIEHRRQQARWARFGTLIESDSLSLSQAALLATVHEGWVRCSRVDTMGKAHETHPANVEWIDGHPVCIRECPERNVKESGRVSP